MNFDDLKLRPELLQGLKKIGFDQCTPIQEVVIPHILEGKDISGLAQTGTGKTAAFVLPIMDRILWSAVNAETLTEEEREVHKKRSIANWKPKQFVLVLVPTRELAEQVYDDVYKLRGESKIEAVAIYGGTSYETQKAKINQGIEFVIGTPGRLIDLYKTHVLDLRQVRVVVFDEADRMFDMGFKDDMKFILRRIPSDRQFLLFSATMNFDVLHTAYQFGAEPVEFNVSRDQAKAENVKDKIYHIGHQEKPSYLLSILKKENPRQTIVFSNFKHNVERIAQFLNDNNFPAVAISSLLTQSQRQRVLTQFKSDNDRNILVATDLAARGLDIKGVDLVINYELPDDCESYVHRIGRTGRAGAIGTAASLVCDRDVEALMRAEEYLKHKIEVGWLDDTQIIKDHRPFPADTGRMSPRPLVKRSDASNDRPFRKPQQNNNRFQRPQGRSQNFDRPDRTDQPDRPNRPERQDRPERTDRPPMRRDGRPPLRGEPQPHRNNSQRPHGSGEQVHRDRRMGRHGIPSGRHGERNSERTQQGSYRPNDRGRNSSERPQRRPLFKNSHRPQDKRIQGAGGSQEGLLLKVSKFFKKLLE